MSENFDYTHEITVSQDEIGLRLDKLLALRFAHLSRTYFQYLIENGCVLVNGSIVKKREKPQIGDEIEVCFLLTPEISLEPENIPLDILYEDDYLLAINKPPGMVVHPAPGHPKGTFVNALLFHCKTLHPEQGDLRPGIVHRLDKDTSGILLAAKTAEAHQKLVSLFSERKIQKHYLAITVGNPAEGWIEAPIGRHLIHRKEMCVNFEKGKEAKSYCTPLATNEKLALVDVQLITGRTHQIRVHLKFRNAPVLGDPLYGAISSNQHYQAKRQMLHAHRIRFEHPITQQTIELTAPLPADFETLKVKFFG
ncbi:MAG: RluA family pseudouridine synthase [Rhabdochlamydiaceae bacterium]|nr:RluA family pseudouridine synthase [Rhabdochlamydiaceae bacterium]